MTIPDYVWWILLPAMVVWGITVIDVLTRPGLRRLHRVAWVLAVTVVFPTALVWLLVRPVAAPAPVAVDDAASGDRRIRLTALVLARQRGQIAQAEYQQQLAGFVRSC